MLRREFGRWWAYAGACLGLGGGCLVKAADADAEETLTAWHTLVRHGDKVTIVVNEGGVLNIPDGANVDSIHVEAGGNVGRICKVQQ